MKSDNENVFSIFFYHLYNKIPYLQYLNKNVRNEPISFDFLSPTYRLRQSFYVIFLTFGSRDSYDVAF